MRTLILCVSAVMALSSNIVHATDMAYFGCSLPQACGKNMDAVTFQYIPRKPATITDVVITCHPNPQKGKVVTSWIPTPMSQLPGALDFIPSTLTSPLCIRAEAGRPR